MVYFQLEITFYMKKYMIHAVNASIHYHRDVKRLLFECPHLANIWDNVSVIINPNKGIWGPNPGKVLIIDTFSRSCLYL